MKLACNKIIPPEEWKHDKMLKNVYGGTVAICLAGKGVIPPEEWMHDINIANSYNDSIKSNLLNNNYIYKNGEFKYNV